MQSKYTEDRVRTEINAILDCLQDQGNDLQPQWVTHQVCDAHRDGLAPLDVDAPITRGDDVAFWEYAGYAYTRKLTTRCVNDREQPDTPAEEPVLPGFEYLHRYYVVTRKGVEVGVAIEALTDDELLAKAEMYEGQSKRLVAHADELRRYVELRRAQRDHQVGAGGA